MMEYRGPDARAIKDLVDKHVAERTSELRQQLAECEAECEEQARLNGMGSEREARLMARLEECERERDGWKNVADTGEEIISARDAKIDQLKTALSDMELHYRGDDGADKYTTHLFIRVRELLK